jgi:hypothetical protein
MLIQTKTLRIHNIEVATGLYWVKTRKYASKINAIITFSRTDTTQKFQILEFIFVLWTKISPINPQIVPINIPTEI